MIDARLQTRIEAYCRAFNARAEVAFLACFHPQGAVGGTLTGQATPGVAVQKAILRAALGGMGDLILWPETYFQSQLEVAITWTGEVEAEAGGRVAVRGIAVFAFDADARILKNRVYWDPRPLLEGEVHRPNAVDPAYRRAVDAYFAAFNRRDWAAFDRIFAKSCTQEGLFGGLQGRDEALPPKSACASAVERLPGFQMRLAEAYQAQNEVAVLWEGGLEGGEGAALPMQGISVFQFGEDGRIGRCRVYAEPLLQEA